MIITKREHACLIVETHDAKLVIDPGMFSPSVDADRVAGVVLTHDHGDHWTDEHLAAIAASNPNARFLGTAETAAAVSSVPVEVVAPGQVEQVGPFSLEFAGGEHAEIYEAFPVSTNVGVIVNDALYHPGDSFALPGRDVAALAVPLGGPWHKLSEAVDFANAVGAKVAFGIHDETLSDAGKSMANDILGGVTGAQGREYHALAVGEMLDLAR